MNQRTPKEQSNIIKWQNKLLPFIVIVPTVLITVFIILATKQVNQINKRLQAPHDTTFMKSLIAKAEKDSTINFEYYKWLALVKMEQESFYKRYNQAELLLMSRIFTKYLGFFTGMILAIVGAVFIIGKIEEKTTDIEGSIADRTKFKLVSSSPGIIFGVLGTILMLSTILQHNDIAVRDMPLYLVPDNKVTITNENLNKPKFNNNDIPEDNEWEKDFHDTAE